LKVYDTSALMNGAIPDEYEKIPATVLKELEWIKESKGKDD